MAVRRPLWEVTCSLFADSYFNLIPATQFRVTGTANSLEFVSLYPPTPGIFWWQEVPEDLRTQADYWRSSMNS